MIRRKHVLLAVFVALSAGASARAATIFTSTLTFAQENPAPGVIPTTTNGTPRPLAFGNAIYTLNDAMTALTFRATICNIDFTGMQTPDTNDNLTNAHIHASATVTPATNAPVVWGFIGMPFNDTTPTDTVVTPFTTGVGGSVGGKWDLPEGNNTTLAAQLENLFAGRAYINFHTVQFPGGEARGAIQPIPEPSTVALFGLGALSMVALRRRKSSR